MQQTARKSAFSKRSELQFDSSRGDNQQQHLAVIYPPKPLEVVRNFISPTLFFLLLLSIFRINNGTVKKKKAYVVLHLRLYFSTTMTNYDLMTHKRGY